MRAFLPNFVPHRREIPNEDYQLISDTVKRPFR
jgi:hypothetical protein